jgi:hypothetical protein
MAMDGDILAELKYWLGRLIEERPHREAANYPLSRSIFAQSMKSRNSAPQKRRGQSDALDSRSCWITSDRVAHTQLD